jgi:UDP-glucose 4-epimerase
MSKIAQETTVRFYDEMSKKIYGVIRMGTVLGEGMPEKTAANIFISRGLAGKPITPYRHSMHRPMLYVDINDVCKAYNAYAIRILKGEICKADNSLAHVVNLCWPKAITIIELSYMIRDAIARFTRGKIRPEIKIVDTDEPIFHVAQNKEETRVDITRVKQLLNLGELTDPKDTIERIVKSRVRLENSL